MRRIVCVLMLAAVTVACGGGGSAGTKSTTGTDTGSESLIATFLAKADDITSFRLQMTMAIPGAPGGDLVYDGEVDVERGLMSLSGTVGDFSLDMVATKDVVYMKLPAAMRKGNKPWAKTDISALGGGGSSALMSSDPGEFFAQMKAFAPDLTETGAGQVRDVVTTVYSGTFDLKTLAAELPAAQRAQVEQASSLLDSTVIPVKLHLGSDGLVYRQEMEMVIQGNTVPFQMDFFDYGKPVSITVPPASQVGSMPSGM